MATDKPKRRRKSRPPVVLEQSTKRAKARTLKRGHGPAVILEPQASGNLDVESPFTGEDWHWLVLDAFGTRNRGVAAVFIRQLTKFCETEWDEDRQEWVPNEEELTAVLNIVASLKPKNEAQAALAAQTAAVHMVSMRLGERAYRYPYDSRTVAIFGKLCRTSAMLHDTMAKLKGKGTSRQKITVLKQSEHKHIHIHQGEPENGGQAHDLRGYRKAGNETFGGGAGDVGGPPLLSQDSAGNVVPMPRDERKGAMPQARRGQGLGRSEG